MVYQDSTNLNNISKYIVDASGDTPYTTIQSAINAALAAAIPATIFIRPGTYIEDLILYDTINLEGANNFDVIINGTHIPPVAGFVLFNNLYFSDATAIFSSANAGTTIIIIQNCKYEVTNGFLLNLTNWAGAIVIENCESLSINDGIIENSAGSSRIYLRNSYIGEQGASMTVNGIIDIESCNIDAHCVFQGAALATIDMGSKFNYGIETSANRTINIKNSTISNETGSPAYLHGSTGAATLLSCTINSDFNPAINGAGTGILTYSELTFEDNSEISATITLNAIESRGGNFPTRYVVSADGDAVYTTIQSAITAASTNGGGTVFIRNGSYTEDLTLADGVNLVGQSKIGTIITGAHTVPASGDIQIRDLSLEATGDINIFVSGSTSIVMDVSNINYNGAVSVLYNLGNFTGTVVSRNIYGTGATDAVIYSTAAGTFNFYNSTFGNGTTPLQHKGSFLADCCTIGCPLSFSSASTATLNNCTVSKNISILHTSTLEITNSTLATTIYNSITHESTGTVDVTNTSINTSASAFTGAGAGIITLTAISFLDSTTIAGTLTVAWENFQSGQIDSTAVVVDPLAASDSFLQFNEASTGKWRIGNDETNDSFKVSQGSALGTNDTFIMTSAGERTMPLQPAFLARLGASQANVTGDGATYTLGTANLTEVFDQNSDFNVNGTFTAPVTGRYLLSLKIYFQALSVDNIYTRIQIVTSNRSYLHDNSVPRTAAIDAQSLTMTVLADMDAADTYTATCYVSGIGANTVTVAGAGNTLTFMSGTLLV